jgi:hypothetical protein
MGSRKEQVRRGNGCGLLVGVCMVNGEGLVDTEEVAITIYNRADRLL